MPVARPRKLFVNLGVKDLDASVAFFTRLGFASTLASPTRTPPASS